MKNLLTYLMLFMGFSATVFAQQIPKKGVPWIDSYLPAQYKNHGKIWDISTAPNGIVYLAGDGGLLEYDGKTWNNFKGSEGYTRSLFVANDSTMYSGSDLDFGVWKRNQLQQFEYTSLYPFRKDPSEQNEEFWGVHQIRDNIIFTSFNNIYIYKNKQLTKIAAPFRFSQSFESGQNLYLADEKNGLYRFDGTNLKLVFDYSSSGTFQIAGVYERDQGLMIATKNSGLYRYHSGKLSPIQNNLSDHLKRNQVFCSSSINKHYYAFGTILNGLYISDFEGNIVQHINKQKGIPNNTVLSMHYNEASGMLWLGMDYGIAALHIHQGLTYFFDYQGEFGTPHTSLLKDGVFYLGTNQGLYRTAWDALNNDATKHGFTLIPGSEGQIWSLADFDGSIWCGHDKGLFKVDDHGFQRIHNEPGVWNILPYQEDYLLTGNYNGVSLFKKQGNGYSFLKKLELILGSCNQLLIEKENLLWVNIPNFGLIRFRLNKKLSVESRKIFPVTLFSGKALQLLKDKKGIHLFTSTQHYLFYPSQQRFIHHATHSPAPVQGLQNGIYSPQSIDQYHQFYPVFNGFALNNTQIGALPKGQNQSLLFRRVEAFNNQKKQLLAKNTMVPYALNNLHFSYIAPQKKGILYQYLLDNYTQSWSDWTSHTSLDFLNLKEGFYSLKLRAKIEDKITPIATFSFRIAPPWYRTGFAYLGYVFLAFLCYYLNRRVQNKRLNQQKELLLEKKRSALQMQAEQYEQEALRFKQQQLEYEKEQMRQQIKQKGIELAKQAKENEDKNRLLHLLKEKMEEVQHAPNISKMLWAEMKRLLDLYMESKDNTFEIQIDELHQEFFQKIKAQFPDLSLYDLRLCVYLKIGLNSKEISDMLQVLPSSINVSRSRLRKKLNLQQDEDLYSFLNKY